jgi:tyrosine-protein phosphatase YwqE
MDFSLQKKELINLKNTIKSLNSKSNEGNQWVLNFSIVKLVSVWEQIIRSYADKSLSEINRNKLIKIEFDKKRLYEYVWKSWLDGKQQNLTDSKIQLEVKNVKRYSKIRNSVAHGNILKPEEKQAILLINDDSDLLVKTLKILEGL